ncbi:amidohydrolase family protein [Pseudomonas sp. PLMAX]|uniref:amidohydrolase family protein n=1 Tax=Pseudomonas sp. PLMAX TaxID=2201998 RepID=UPI0038B7E2E3
MHFPIRIVDMHTHLFNARYMPLASVIADAMRKPDSALANGVANLLVSLTGSSYKEQKGFFAATHFLSEEAKNEYRIDQIWKITQHELLSRSGSRDAVNNGPAVLRDIPFSSQSFNRIPKSDISVIVDSLATIDYAAEGFDEPEPAALDQPAPAVIDDLFGTTLFKLEWPLGNVLDHAEKAVKKSLRAVTALMDPMAWGKPENYLEFFLTMLNSEEDMLTKVMDGYGPGLPPLQIVHFMMDMQMAYPGHKEPHYPFFPTQVEFMQNLQRKHPNQVYGFCAFDPRRPGDWRKRCQDAIAKGFIGFKFYPPLGYKPFGDEAGVQAVTNEFFDFCVEGDIPIFTHCTPQGFQTHLKEGKNAHPNNWKSVLETPKWNNLRLCLGHAGGEDVLTDDINSAGWMAADDNEWIATDNFARIVTELCTNYPNVYCEVANMFPMLNKNNGATFVSNLERARKAAATDGRPYDLMDKIAYGTDWHMPDMVDNTRRYFEVFLNIMNREEYRPHIDKFFWENSYNYMKVTK